MTRRNGEARYFFPPLEQEFRRLSGELQTAFASAKSILVASALGGEGVTTTAVNLARVVAEDRARKILVVDANFYNPTLHLFFDLELARGIQDWDMQSPPVYKQTQIAPNLFALTAGTRDSSAPVSYKLALLPLLAQQVRDAFDFIIWDAPPLIRYPDGLALVTIVDGILLVIEADRTKTETLGLIREQFLRVDAKLLGAILNRSGRFLPRMLRNRYDG